MGEKTVFVLTSIAFHQHLVSDHSLRVLRLRRDMYLRQRLPVHHRLVRNLRGICVDLRDGDQVPVRGGHDGRRHTILSKRRSALDADDHGVH